MPTELLAFVAVAAVLIMVPGADMALVARNTVGFGRRNGLITSAGILVGVTVHATAAAVGLSAVIAASSQLFAGLRTLGAVYLVWLGVQAWRQAPEGHSSRATSTGDPIGVPTTSRFLRPFAQGLITNVLNPKLVVFFMTFVPQFVAPGGAALSQIIVLSIVFVLLSIVWLLLYVAILGRFADTIALPTVRRWLDRAAGTVLIGLGLRLALDRG